MVVLPGKCPPPGLFFHVSAIEAIPEILVVAAYNDFRVWDWLVAPVKQTGSVLNIIHRHLFCGGKGTIFFNEECGM